MSSKLSILDELTMPIVLLGAAFRDLDGRPINGKYNKKSHALSLDFHKTF
jgi:hypothetical protein